MFSGIVERMVPVVAAEKRGKGLRLALRLDRRRARLGDSVAVNGVCLTVASLRKGLATFDIMPETRTRTTLGQLEGGERVNIEHSLRSGDPLGGHFVLGHVDARGRVLRVERSGRYRKLWISAIPPLVRMLIPKGPVAVEGVSLTVVDVRPRSFSVCLIPRTLRATTLGFRKEGDSVNIEADIIGKYVKKLLAGKGFR